MTDATAIPCAAASATDGEPLVATASRVRSWLAIEQPGAWGIDALRESGLDPDVGAALTTRGRKAGVRTILVRRPRPSPAPASAHRQCFLAHSGPRSSWAEVMRLDDPAALLSLDLAALASDRPPGIGAAVQRPVFLVCTNGRHDRCCADFGRPLVRSLVSAGVADVWECSHIGGDRFAANVVCLPEGVYFGRVGPEDGPTLAAAYAAGQLSLDHYRGRSCYPALVQAAESWVRRTASVTALDGLSLVAVERLGPDRAEVTFAANDASSRNWRARVSRTRSDAPRRLTCRASSDARPWDYHLEELTPRE